MAILIPQSTAYTFRLGPFLDSTDGNTQENSLTIAYTNVLLSKTGGALAAKNDTTNLTDTGANAHYTCVLNTTDTGTLGALRVWCHVSGALCVYQDFMVVPALVYNGLVAGSDNLQVDTVQVGGTTQTAGDIAAMITAVDDFVDTEVSAIKAKTDNLPANPAAVSDIPTAATVADAVWDEARSGHTTSGSFGEGAASVQGSVTGAVGSVTGNVGGNVTGSVASVTGNVGGNVVGSVGSLATQAKADVNAEVDTALSDVNLDHLVGTATGIPAIVAGTYIDQMMDDGTAVYDRTTDSLQAIRDRGDAAWTTGAGGSDRLLMVDTTIATLTSQTSFTLTAGSADNNAYLNCTIVIEDAVTSTQKAVGIISAYTGATKTVTLKYDPAIFTMAAGDKVYILAENSLKSTAQNRQLDVAATGAVGSVTGLTAANLDATISSRSSHSAADVWAVGTRTLTSFGTLVSDIWSNSTRTLTAFSTALAVSVWDVLESAIATASSIGLKLKTNLDATVSSRLSSAGYTAPDNAGISSILSESQSHPTLAEIEASTFLAKEATVATVKAKTDTIAWTDITDIKDESLGKWSINKSTNVLTFYRSDGVTVLKSFNLTDNASVSERVPV